AANLDPFGHHATLVDVPIGELGIAPDASYRMRELLTDAVYEWRGGGGSVALDPHAAPAQIFHLERLPPTGTKTPSSTRSPSRPSPTRTATASAISRGWLRISTT